MTLWLSLFMLGTEPLGFTVLAMSFFHGFQIFPIITMTKEILEYRLQSYYSKLNHNLLILVSNITTAGCILGSGAFLSSKLEEPAYLYILVSSIFTSAVTLLGVLLAFFKRWDDLRMKTRVKKLPIAKTAERREKQEKLGEKYLGSRVIKEEDSDYKGTVNSESGVYNGIQNKLTERAKRDLTPISENFDKKTGRFDFESEGDIRD